VSPGIVLGIPLDIRTSTCRVGFIVGTTDMTRRHQGIAIALLAIGTLAGCGGEDDGRGTGAWALETGTTGADESDSDSDTTSGTGEGECTPGEARMCACAAGFGSQRCDGDGSGFGACECDDAPAPGDDGTAGEPPDLPPGGDSGGEESSGGEPPLEGVCYPGEDESWTTCLPIHAMDPLPEGYEYAAGFNGDPNYRPPIAFLDLEEVSPDTWLAPNFQLVELAQLYKGRWAIVQPHAVASLQELRDQVGAIGVNSAYRSPGYNAQIGGATYSRHMYGDGFDLDPAEVSNATLENACTSIGGMLVEYGTHVHCDFRFDPADPMFFGAAAERPPQVPSMTARVEPEADGSLVVVTEGFDEGAPTRRWTALAADGRVLAEGRGARFDPPRGTAKVEVLVGRVLTAQWHP
jgi:hypothetical protein